MYGAIGDYYDAILCGGVTVGKRIRDVYEFVIYGLDAGWWFFDVKKANRAIRFIENFCHHSEGRSDLLRLELWQKALVSVIFGVIDSEGNRQFREVFLMVARKNGKTLLAAAIAAYMAYADGEYGAKIYCLAPKLEQAELVYDAFYQIVRSDDELDGMTKRRRQDIYIADLNTSVKKIAFNSKKSDGFNPHLAVCDEMEAWVGDAGLKQYEVMKSALGARRQPLLLSTSTAGYITGGIFDELFLRATRLLGGWRAATAESSLKGVSAGGAKQDFRHGGTRASAHEEEQSFPDAGVKTSPYGTLTSKAEENQKPLSSGAGAWGRGTDSGSPKTAPAASAGAGKRAFRDISGTDAEATPTYANGAGRDFAGLNAGASAGGASDRADAGDGESPSRADVGNGESPNRTGTGEEWDPTVEMRFLPLLYMVDDPGKWDDLEELKKANPNLGVSVKVSFYRDEIVVARSSSSKKAEFLCKYCNVKQNSAIAWLDWVDVDRASGETIRLEDFRGCYCVGGVDLSRTTDLTAASVVIERGGVFYLFTQFFMPKERIDAATEEDGLPYRIYAEKGWLTLSGDNAVNYHDVHDWFVALVKKYKIMPQCIGYDRYSAQYLIQELSADGFRLDDVYQGTNLSPMLSEFEGLLKDGKIRIGDNQLLKAHLLSVGVQINASDSRMKPVKIRPEMHIDGFVSIIDALTVRSKYFATIGKLLKNEPKNAFLRKGGA